ARGARARARRAARGGGVLRLRRHLRGQERRHLARHARRQVPLRLGDRRRGLHRGRRLVPDADRRRALASARSRSDGAPGRDPGGDVTDFPEAARAALADPQLRANLRNATQTIRAKRAAVVSELPDWEELREAGRAIKADVLLRLDEYLP